MNDDELDNRIESYRSLDAQLASLVTLTRIGHDFTVLMRAEREVRKYGHIGRLLGSLAIGVTATSVVFALLPKEGWSAELVMCAVGSLSSLYVINLLVLWWKQDRHDQMLDQVFPVGREDILRVHTELLATKISATGTRLTLATAIVGEIDDGPLCQKFEAVVAHCSTALERYEREVERLGTTLSSEDHDLLTRYIASARK